jgi:hypothetical protein
MPVRSLVFALVAAAAALAQQASAPPEETVRIEGRVVDLRGEPVPAAEVWVTTWRERDKALVRTVCDGDGIYLLPRVPKRESMHVCATAPGKVLGRAWYGSSFVEVQLHDAVRVTGVLRDRGGKPIVGAVVRAELDGARILYYVDARATTDAEGRFTLDKVPIGTVAVAAVVPGEGLAEVRRRVVADTEFDLAPGKEASADMTVTVKGLPAEAAGRVRLRFLPYSRGHHCQLPPPWESPSLEAGGSLELLHLPDYDYVVGPTLTGFVFAPQEIRVKAGKGPHRLEFTAEPVGSTALRWAAELHDGDGKPIGGANLVMSAANGGLRSTAVSAADGTLLFDAPLAIGAVAVVHATGEQWVLDQKKDEREMMFNAWDLTKHKCNVDPTTKLSLVAIPACKVTGRVLLPDGRPAPFVEVGLEESSPNRFPHWGLYDSASTDRNGNYVCRGLHHIDRPVRVHVEGRAGSAASDAMALVEPGTMVAAPDLQLTAPARIEGVVRDADGRGMPGVRVWLRDWDFNTKNLGSGSVVEVITDKLGRYRFLGVPPGGAGLHTVEGWQDGRALEPFEVEAGKTLTFDLVLPGK